MEPVFEIENAGLHCDAQDKNSTQENDIATSNDAFIHPNENMVTRHYY